MEEILRVLIEASEEIAATCPAGKERNCWTRLANKLRERLGDWQCAHCRSCKWWLAPLWLGDPSWLEKRRECVRHEKPEALFMIRGEHNYEGYLFTLPDFGCIQFEKMDA